MKANSDMTINKNHLEGITEESVYRASLLGMFGGYNREDCLQREIIGYPWRI